MAGFTNKGKYLMLRHMFNGLALPTNFYVALCTSAVTPTADTNTFSDLTEIAAGNGYTAGGISLTKNTTDFPTVTEDDANDRGSILIKNLTWTASVGNLPASGNGARWMILTDDNATQGSRFVYAYVDLTADRTVSVAQNLNVNTTELRFNEV